MKPPGRIRPGIRPSMKLWGRSWLIALGALVAAAGEPRTVQLRHQDAAPKFDGWGTSLCWFANAVGRWPEPHRSAVADALFSADGLGLTVVRYNIGGGENPEHRHMPWFRQMEGFQPAPGVWNWEADPGQRWMLAAAVQRGANRLEAFANAPPHWMTLSRCASGGPDPKTDNLDPQQETAFAEYLTRVVQHFHTEWNLRFDTLSPMNEPCTDYWRANGNQEGCHFDRASQARLIRLLRTVLDRHDLGPVKISAADETNYDRAIGTWESYDAQTRAGVAQINAHAYATQRRTELHALALASGKPLVMSEADGPGGGPHDHTAMEPALTLAGQIIDDLRDLRPLRWVFWQAVEDEAGMAGSNINWGLIHADLQGDTHAWIATKKYHALGNFSKFIRPGAVPVQCDATDTIAAYDGTRHVLVIVTRNAQPDDEPVTYDVAPFGRGLMPVEAYRTSATEDLVRTGAEPATRGQFSAVAPARSITTYVVTLTKD